MRDHATAQECYQARRTSRVLSRKRCARSSATSLTTALSWLRRSILIRSATCSPNRQTHLHMSGQAAHFWREQSNATQETKLSESEIHPKERGPPPGALTIIRNTSNSKDKSEVRPEWRLDSNGGDIRALCGGKIMTWAPHLVLPGRRWSVWSRRVGGSVDSVKASFPHKPATRPRRGSHLSSTRGQKLEHRG